MKTILNQIIIIVTFFCSINCCWAQNGNSPFVGKWKWQNGNQIFYVDIFVDEEVNRLRGNYKLVQIASNGIDETLIYKSNKDLPFGLTNGPEIYLGPNDTDTSVGGFIWDNTYTNNDVKQGEIDLKILTGSLSGVIQASWKVKRGPGIFFIGEPDYNIPTDIILTKVE